MSSGAPETIIVTPELAWKRAAGQHPKSGELVYVRADLVRKAMPDNWGDDPDTLALARALGMDARIKDRP